MIKVALPNLVNPVIIEAFFGDSAKSYSYTVSPEEFDEHDNEGPGHYCGVEVSAEDAARWDAGLHACKEVGVNPRSVEGLRLRLEKFGRAERAAAVHQALADQLAGPIIHSWEEETEGCELFPITQMPGWVIVVPQDCIPEYRAYALAVSKRAEEKCGWAWIWRDDQYDAELLDAIRKLWAKTAPGWLVDSYDSAVEDAAVRDLHSHSCIAHHLGGESVSNWPKKRYYRGRVVVARIPDAVR